MSPNLAVEIPWNRTAFRDAISQKGEALVQSDEKVREWLLAPLKQ